VGENDFIDYYEVLQLSASADGDTIERVFRHLAKKYHPDNKESGSTDRFLSIVEAHRVLSDPEIRAGYDVRHQEYWNRKWKVASEARSGAGFDDDAEHRESLLSLLYVQRRRDMKKPGLGDYELARLLSIPFELVQFHVWYLKAKGWVELLDTGQLAISALGVDQVEQGRLRLRTSNMLTPGGVAADDNEPQTTRFASSGVREFPRPDRGREEARVFSDLTGQCT
jgi:curved DNA-binding protein